jgi:hypothetical protein
VESKWRNYHITTFPGQSLSKTGLSLEEAMDLSRDKQKKDENGRKCFKCKHTDVSHLQQHIIPNLPLQLYGPETEKDIYLQP